MEIEELMRMTKKRGASDLILTSGSPPVLRIDKKLVSSKLGVLSPSQIESLLVPLMDEPKKEEFKKTSDISFIYSLSGWGRFRVTLFKQRGSMAVAIRRFPYEFPSVKELRLPEPTLKHFCGLKDGLVLVTGPAGGGKSTTLACMTRMLNETESIHIITLEKPIEYLFKHNKSVIEQRAILYDSPSFPDALKEILRQSPDVVIVGEIDEPETLRHTLRLAESGILVLATFHTATASDTLNRLINFLPREEEQTKLQLSLVLRGVLSQQLIPVYQKPGVVPAWEVLIVNERVMSIIRQGAIQQIDNVIETSFKMGMQSMDKCLVDLYKRKLISKTDLLLRLRHRGTEVLEQKDFLSAEDQKPQADSDSYNPEF